MSDPKQEGKPKKGEPWKPKEKFDKKGNKEKQKQEQIVENKKQEQIQEKPKDQIKFDKPQQVESIVETKIEVIKQDNNSFLKHLQQLQHYTTATIIQQPNINPQLFHPAIIQLCLNYQNRNYIGSTYRCVEFLKALKIYIQDFKSQKGQLHSELYEQLKGVIQLIQKFRSINEGIQTAFKFVQHLITLLYNERIEEQEMKNWLYSQIDEFIKIRIVNASESITHIGQQLIQDGSSILIFARSYLVEKLLIKAHQGGKQFQVYLIDNPPFNEGQKLMESLEFYGIRCTMILLSHVSYIINKIDKIFVGASSILNDGSMISRVGTGLLACVSSEFKIPFYVFSESYKFSDRCQVDSLSWNELAQQEEKEISLMYDVTPYKMINMIVTEIGLVEPKSVKTILREFQRYNYVDKIQISKQIE